MVQTKDGLVNGFGPRLVHSRLSAYLYRSSRPFVCLHAVLEEAQMGPGRQGVT